MSKYILSIDAGTTGITVILFDKNTNIIKKKYSEFSQIYPKTGYVEHDPLEIWTTTEKLLIDILQDYKNKIHSIGITNQRETIVAWNKKTGQPIHNAIVWQCKRTLSECKHLIEKGYSNIIQEKTGLVIDSYFSATKIQWLINNIPEAKILMEKEELICGTIDTWLIWNLTNGEYHLTEHTNASRTMLYNINTFDWDDELLDIFNIDKSILPKITNSASHFGDAITTIFDNPVPITGVVGDQQAALFGQYGIRENDTKCTYGTGCFILTNTGEKKIISNHGMLTTIACNEYGKPTYALEGSVFIGGAVIQWLRDELKIITSAYETDDIAQSINDTNGVFVVPAFSGLGAPHWNMESRGIITGITRGANKKHIVRAALESIAFQVNDLINCLNKDMGAVLTELKVDGGATQNNFLMQFQSNISNLNIIKPNNIELTALGAALLSGISSKYWKNMDSLLQNRNLNKKYSPELNKLDRKKLLDKWAQAIEKCLA